MNQRHQELADEVLAEFRSKLEASDQAHIGEARFGELHGLVCEALAEELEAVTNRVAALAQDLRAEIDKPPIEL
jgi:urease accessory protein UreH